MKLTGLHILLTYQCTFECDHCFAWGSPWQEGTLTLKEIRNVLGQAKDLGTVQWIYFEGGEPFLYYATLVRAVREAAEQGFQVGIVSNAYWATSMEDAIEWLQPFAGLIQDLSVSSDLFHYSELMSLQASNAEKAAQQLEIPIGVISIAKPEGEGVNAAAGQLPEGESGVMYRGRAVDKLLKHALPQPWDLFTECPYEDLQDPGRVHLDPLGNLHLCQGISIGNMFLRPLSEIWADFVPEDHPIVAPILRGGPAELARHYDVSTKTAYADACHLCYTARDTLRGRFPEILVPDQMYGVVGNP
ncbi:MAG: radical SAM protein [Planctomycetota bacterium]|jgi:MoaA/NifB/PqqE/SkfB family radical SAM enzyme